MTIQKISRLGEEYQAISDKALAIPKHTADLMALIDYVNDVERVTLLAMEQRLQEIMKYMLFLADHALYSPVEIKQNNTTFLWYLRMPRVIEEHRQMVDSKMQYFQEKLNEKIKKFKDDLELYAKMVDDMQLNGNIDDLPKYHKKATQLETRFISY